MVFDDVVSSTKLWFRRLLEEGPYHWRVRADHPEAPYSDVRMFHLIEKPLPDAPELIDSEIEIVPRK